MADTEASTEERIITPAELEAKIIEGLNGNVYFIEAVDLSDGCGAKFEVEIVSSEFKGKPLLAQHRLVHKIIEEERKFIHALTLKTKAPPAEST
jgi:stress-induced morphogen